MNPAILGALIGTIPGTIAAGLASWSAIRSTHLTMAENHDRWLREKRADIYVDLLKFIEEARSRRFVILKPGEVTEEIQRKLKDGFDIYLTPEVGGLAARAYAYTSKGASDAFVEAWNNDMNVWRLAQNSIQAGKLKIDDELNQAINDADDAASTLTRTVAKDLQTPFAR